MEYLKAFKLDTTVKAYIRCTFVELFDHEGKKVFSLNTPAFPKSQPIGTATFEAVKSDKDLVPIAVSDQVSAILKTYGRDVIKTDKGVKFPTELLKQRFFFVHQGACNWIPSNVSSNGETEVVTKDEDGNVTVEPVVKQTLPKKTKLALLAAAVLAALGN